MGEPEQSAAFPTVGQWLAQCQPAPPKALADRLARALDPYKDDAMQTLPEACLSAGELILDGLLASGSTSRESALDLLTVDALVTYAFQLAADDPTRLEARAARAMARIAAVPAERRSHS